MQDDQLVSLVSPLVTRFGLELEALDSVPAGKRRVLKVVVDGDGPDGRGPTLDDIAAATKAISGALDEADLVGGQAYTLEVSSRGVARPLTAPRHWRRNHDRLVRVSFAGGDSVTGRILRSDDHSAWLTVVTDAKRGTSVEREVAYADVAKAVIQVELNRKAAGELTDIEEGDD